MPSLAERKQDIPLIAKHFLDRFNRRSGTRKIGFSKEAMDLLCSYEYPGNVRELENIVERTAALSRSEIIDIDTFPDDLKELRVFSLQKRMQKIKTLQEIEQEHIEKALVTFGQNKSKAAAALGINRVSLHRKLKKSQIKE